MTPALNALFTLPQAHDNGDLQSIVSICSAHPVVIRTALQQAAIHGQIACIEATCNQVNQDGGYTGMTPADFRAFVLTIAKKVAFPPENILFGGDHLGPNPWRKLPAAQAMAKAIDMTRAYAAAGFSKIHLDASMSCADDPAALPPDIMAERAALLAQAAEQGAGQAGHPAPAYIIGTEVPVPGGAAEFLDGLIVTSAGDAAETLAMHARSFAALGLDAAFDRVVGLVVQPGVEFGQHNVIAYDPAAAASLIAARPALGLIYEAHSTDYQTPQALGALVQGGFAILKVGPGLTFALREALYGLDQIAGEMGIGYRANTLPNVMERVMLAQPDNWAPYCHGDEKEQHCQRHFGLSDRIRYYWTTPKATKAVAELMRTLQGRMISQSLLASFLPCLSSPMTAETALSAIISKALSGYFATSAAIDRGSSIAD